MIMKNISLFLIILSMILVEVLTSTYLYLYFRNNEDKDRDDMLKQTVTSLHRRLDTYDRSFRSEIYRDSALFNINGKYLSPRDYKILLQANNSIYATSVESRRWIPYIPLSERSLFEQFYGQYYSNFTIRDISFINGAFVIKPATIRDFYYPFTLSEPQFNLTPMGGDFYLSSEQFKTVFNQSNTIVYSDRVRLSRINNNRIFGIFIQIWKPNVGVTQHLIVISEALNEQVTSLNLPRNNFVTYIYISSGLNKVNLNQQLLYREENLKELNSPNELKEFTSQKFTYQFTIEPFHYIIRFKPEYITSLHSSTPEIILITVVIISILVDLCMFMSYRFYCYRIETLTNNLYRDMLNYINHEMRNPLNALTGALTIMLIQIENTPLSDIDKEQLLKKISICRGQCSVMTYIIDRVKRLKIATDKTYHQNHPIDHQELLITDNENTIFTLEEILELLGLCMKTKVEEHGYLTYDTLLTDNVTKNMTLNTDKNKLYEILVNFLDNAVKYSKPDQEGKIELIISKDDTHIKFKVSDTGIGIPSEYRSKLFNVKEFRINKNTISGTGMGLYYAKILATKIGSNINYVSEPDIGSSFSLELPMQPIATENKDNNSKPGFVIFNVPKNISSTL